MQQHEAAYQSACDRLMQGPCAVHLMGAGGVGVAGVARLLQQRGFTVSGCDLVSSRMTSWLLNHDLELALGHDPVHLDGGIEWLIYSAAVPDDHPEIEAARSRGLLVHRRADVLPALIKGFLSTAVAGSHGKTTTSAMLTHILAKNGQAPTWCIGGEPATLSGAAELGRGEAMIVEADESDGRLGLYEPDYAVIGNIDYDHAEHFANEEQFAADFEALAARTRRRLILGADNPAAMKLAAGATKSSSAGFAETARVRIENWRQDGLRQIFDLVLGGTPLGQADLAMPGRHNAVNAALAVTAALEYGVMPQESLEALADFRLPRRRFEPVCEAGGIRVFADYAHHPTEIRALIDAVQGLEGNRIMAIFQPHRYSRTWVLGEAFPPAFIGVDALVLAPVYAASEAVLEGGTSADLAVHFEKQDIGPVHVEVSLEAAWDLMLANLEAGDILLIIGAGDVEKVAGWAAAALEKAGP